MIKRTLILRCASVRDRLSVYVDRLVWLKRGLRDDSSAICVRQAAQIDNDSSAYFKLIDADNDIFYFWLKGPLTLRYCKPHHDVTFPKQVTTCCRF